MTSVTCAEFENLVHDLVRMELLDVREREAMLEHTAICAHCAQRMADAISLAEASQTIRESAREEQIPPRIEAAILAAFREHHRKRSWWPAFEWAGIGAAAAVLLLVLVWIAGVRLKPRPTPVQRKDAAEPLVPLDAKAPVNSTPAEAVVAGRTVRSATSAASQGAVYTASDFVPVPYAGAIAPDDPGMVVRVQLTRASLAQLGYPVAETPDEDLISADVLVGEDGWPRGVKLIQ